MNILITRFPYESSPGGEEWHTVELAKSLRAKGHQCCFLGNCPVLLNDFKREKFETEKCWTPKMPVTPLALATFLLLLPITYVILRKHFLDIVKRKKINVLYCLSLTEKILLTRLAHRRNIRTIWVEHQQIRNWLMKSPLRLAYMWLSRYAHIVPISTWNRKKLEALKVPENHIVGILNGIQPLGQKKEKTSKKITVGIASRLTEKKGVDTVIVMAGILKKREEDFEIEIIGDGPERKHLENMVTEKKLKNITFVRRCGREEFKKRFLNFDIFIMPSTDDAETFGLTAAEAMDAGIPTIITAVCGIAKYVENNRDAYIVPPKDSEALAKTVERLLSDENTRKRVAAKGKEKAKSLFSWNTMVEAYENLIQGKQKRLTVMIIDPAKIVGGAELFASEMAAGLEKKGHDVHVLTSGGHEYQALYKNSNVKIHRIFIPKLNPFSPLTILRFIRSRRALKKALTRIAPDIVITNTVRAHVVASKPTVSAGIPLIWIMHDDTFPAWILKRFIRLPNHIFTCSKYIADLTASAAENKMKRKIEVLLNGVDLKKVAAEPKKRTANTVTIGTVGRLVPWKGQEFLILAMRELIKKHPNLSCVIVGKTEKTRESKEYLKKLKDIVEEHSLSDHVEIIENATDIQNHMRRFDIFVHTATKPEPFGRVIIEAMASATPVVANPLGGPAEIIDDGVDGFLIPSSNTEVLVDRIRQLIENEKLAELFAINALEKIRERFTLDKSVEKLEDTIRNILEKNT
jgi:glycosyltransferase involved in cell wall biosynthesis